MPRLEDLSDEDLLRRTERLVERERKITLGFLKCLIEIEARDLHLSRSYSSLHSICQRRFRFSEPAASRRVGAMRVLRDHPDLEEFFLTGKLNLTILSLVNTFFRREPGYDAHEKQKEILRQVIGLTKTGCERYLAGLAPLPIPEESEQILSDTVKLIRVPVDLDLDQKLVRVRELYSNVRAKLTYSQLFGIMADDYLKHHDPEKKRRRKSSATPPAGGEMRSASRYIPANIEAEVWRRDGSQCAFIDTLSGSRCESRYFLEIDHSQVPFSYGGRPTLENLRLLCRPHNQLHAKRTFGHAKMNQYGQKR